MSCIPATNWFTSVGFGLSVCRREKASSRWVKKPAIRQIEVDLVAQPPFGANAEAVADNEHPDHQLRIDRRATRLAAVRLQMRSNLRKVDEPVDPAKQVIVGKG